jgi:hypothetical protein
VLVTVNAAVEVGFGLRLIERHVVRDFEQELLPTLVRAAERRQPDDLRVGRGDRAELGSHLGEGVVGAIADREIRSGRDWRRDREDSGCQEEEAEPGPQPVSRGRV